MALEEPPVMPDLDIHPALRSVVKSLDGYAGRFHDLLFIVSAACEADGKWWLHASVSRRDSKMPTHEDLSDLKRLCIGDGKYAYQVFPPESLYVHKPPTPGGKKEVLHLWHCLDGDPLPEFSAITAYGRSI